MQAPAAIAPVDFARAKFCDVFSKFAMSIDVGDLSDLHERLLDLTDNDDLAIAHDTLSRIYESRHDFISAEFHLLESRRHLELFDATGVSIRSVFVEAGYLLKT